MKTYKITKANFLEWYFNTGADDEQESMRTSLGNSLVEELFEKGTSTTTVENIFEESAKDSIPYKFLEGFDKDNWEEVGDIEEEPFEIVLID